MKRIFVTLIFSVPLLIFSSAQNTKNISIGLTFSPDYCYRILKPNSSITSQWIASTRDTLEIPKFGFTTGLNIVKKINDLLSIEIGLLYSDKGENTKKYPVTAYYFYSPPLSFLNPEYVTLFYHYIYLDIPIKVNFYLLTQHTKLYLTAGVSPNLFITEKVNSIVEYSDGHTETGSSSGNSAGYSAINLAVIVGAGLSYDITDKFYIKTEPVFRSSITSIIDAPIKGYLYSIGMNTGIYIKL